MEHILEKYLFGVDSNLRGFIFEFVHVTIMLIGYYSGWVLIEFLKLPTNIYGLIFGTLLTMLLQINCKLYSKSFEIYGFRYSLERILPGLTECPIIEKKLH